MRLPAHGLKSGFAVGLGIFTVSAIFAIFVSLVFTSRTSIGDEIAHAQGQTATGEITKVVAETPMLTVGPGDTFLLSVLLYGDQKVQDVSLGSDVIFNWSASGGDLPPDTEGNTSVQYTAPLTPVTQTVTVTASSNCASNCMATFTIRVRHTPAQFHLTAQANAQNPNGEIPPVLVDAEGNRYAVLTPEEGGTFSSGDLEVMAEPGDVPNNEYIGVRMFEDGMASNPKMSHHGYTLSGNQYRIAVIDAEGMPISSYNLNGTVAVCIPLPEELRNNISNVAIVTKNSNETTTARGTGVRISPSLIMCGNISILPATVAVGIRGKSQPLIEPEPAEMLPATGGAVPMSLGGFAWAFLIGVVLIATGTFATTHRRHEGIR